MYESSGSQFFRTNTWIQMGPVASYQSKLFMTILTILGVKEILCSFRLVLEGKTGKKMSKSSRLKFLEKFLGNNFALSDAKVNTSGLFNRGGIVDLLLFRRLLAICQRSRGDVFFCYISICKFSNFRNLFATITSLPELNFRFRKFILFVQMKKVISMNRGSNTSSWKLWRQVRLDLIFMMRDIYSRKRITFNANCSYYQASSP